MLAEHVARTRRTTAVNIGRVTGRGFGLTALFTLTPINPSPPALRGWPDLPSGAEQLSGFLSFFHLCTLTNSSNFAQATLDGRSGGRLNSRRYCSVSRQRLSSMDLGAMSGLEAPDVGSRSTREGRSHVHGAGTWITAR